MALDPQLPIPYSLTGPTGFTAPAVPHGPAGPARAVAPPRRNEATLAHQAGLILAESRAWVDPDERFRLAHLGALRTAAALFADRARPAVRRRPTNAWVLLSHVAPELADWATYFAAGASKRAAIEAGARQVVTAREADDLLRAATEFLTMVEVSLGIFSDARAS